MNMTLEDRDRCFQQPGPATLAHIRTLGSELAYALAVCAQDEMTLEGEEAERKEWLDELARREEDDDLWS